jgi:hypothetical protein
MDGPEVDRARLSMRKTWLSAIEGLVPDVDLDAPSFTRQARELVDRRPYRGTVARPVPSAIHRCPRR